MCEATATTLFFISQLEHNPVLKNKPPSDLYVVSLYRNYTKLFLSVLKLLKPPGFRKRAKLYKII